MGCVQQAVLEFDEEVRAPWRPRLVAAVGAPSGEDVPDTVLPAYAARRHSSRVGACRPSEGAIDRVSGAGVRGAGAVGEGSGRLVARPGSGARPAGRRPRRSRLRLTRRARRLGLVLALAAGVALGSWVGSLIGGAGGGDLRLAGVTSVVVQPGDTLWSIAAPIAGDGDVRAEVAEIRRLNGLSSARLVPGQTLQLP
jgi:nucleoid-associated protein YgaU